RSTGRSASGAVVFLEVDGNGVPQALAVAVAQVLETEMLPRQSSDAGSLSVAGSVGGPIVVQVGTRQVSRTIAGREVRIAHPDRVPDKRGLRLRQCVSRHLFLVDIDLAWSRKVEDQRACPQQQQDDAEEESLPALSNGGQSSFRNARRIHDRISEVFPATQVWRAWPLPHPAGPASHHRLAARDPRDRALFLRDRD